MTNLRQGTCSEARRLRTKVFPLAPVFDLKAFRLAGWKLQEAAVRPRNKSDALRDRAFQPDRPPPGRRIAQRFGAAQTQRPMDRCMVKPYRLNFLSIAKVKKCRYVYQYGIFMQKSISIKKGVITHGKH